MIFEIHNNDQITTYDLEAFLTNLINVGRRCKEVWNTIALDNETVDPFQCYLIGSAGVWRLHNGQNRTECPKGLVSSKQIPCNTCTGRCVNIRPGKPRYYQRNPEHPTLVNQSPVGEFGTYLKAGDHLQLGDLLIVVRES